MKLQQIIDPTGTITVAEKLPFEIKRVYALTDVTGPRGGHAHKTLRQLVVCLAGSVQIDVEYGVFTIRTKLSDPAQGFLIEPGGYRVLKNFAPGTVLLVLCDQEYDEADYLRSYPEFYHWSQHRFSEQS